MFRVGNDGDPAAWATAPAPTSFRVQENVSHPNFAGHPDVVTFTWADEDPYTKPREAGAISDQWLQIAVVAGGHTGLAANDVFYFGNQIGESGNSASDTNVDQNDEIGARNHPHSAFNVASVSDPYDFNCDGKVDQNDEILGRNNPASAFSRISLIAAPSMLQAAGLDGLAPSSATTLSVDALAATVAEAIARWEFAGVSAADVQTLRRTRFVVANFAGRELGETSPAFTTVYLDDDAAGLGWFLDGTARQDEEFSLSSDGGKDAVPGSAAYGRIDLLTTVMHEMGHVLGRPDLDVGVDDLMAERLTAGLRRGPSLSAPSVHDAAFADSSRWS